MKVREGTETMVFESLGLTSLGLQRGGANFAEPSEFFQDRERLVFHPAIPEICGAVRLKSSQAMGNNVG